jgi:hypothetical protein
MKSTSWVLAALCCILAVSFYGAASAANIAWVSFHAADNTPSAAAATAGFTQAPDIGYTNALTAAGHTVTRFVTKNDPTPADLATLNMSDLIIIGRSVASDNYQQAGETLFWNTTLTKPVINTNGYTVRNSRLGLNTGATIPDTGPTAAAGGPVRLQVTNPSHPIFAGVALDGTNTMVNLYADVVTTPFAPNTPQRGISVVTNPIVAGGQALATVNTAGDLANGGTVIALFPPGTMTAAATAPTALGAHRLIFLTGSREHDGLTSQGSGIYDLSADGGRMFLNAVNFMLAIPEPSTGILLVFAVAGLGMLRKR